MIFVTLTNDEFKAICDTFENSNYYQTDKWGELKKFTGWDAHFVAVKENNNYVAIGLLLSKNIFNKKKIFYSPRGPLLDYNNFKLLEFFTSSIKNYIIKNNGFMFKIDPCICYKYRDKNGRQIGSNYAENIISSLLKLGYVHHGFTSGYNKDVQYRWTYQLNLNVPFEEIIKAMDKRCRRCIRKSDNYPLIAKEIDQNNIYDFKKIMEHTSQRQKHFDRSLEYYLKLKDIFKDRIFIKVIYLDREEYLKKFTTDKLYNKIKEEKRDLIPLSAAIFIEDNNEIRYVYGGTYSYYMSFMAQYKMQINMIKYAKAQGKKIYDFGGISGNFNPKSLYYGTYEFKRGFGGNIIEYIGEFDLPINKQWYFLYKVAYKLYKSFKKITLLLSKIIYK